MELFLSFFETMPIWLKLGWVVGCIAFFWVLEGYYSPLAEPYRKWKHVRVNFGLLTFVIIINAVFGLLTGGIFLWLDQNEIGLLHSIEAPVWLELLLSIIALDLVAQYGVHFLLHKVRWMWRLHLVHHSDKHVDVTTGTRHHPLDFIVRELFALITVLLMGMPISFYFFYRILSVLFTYWTHANIKLPLWLDKSLSYVIVTPNMHKFHHHFELPWTDSNYGNMLSVWDRVFGTFVYGDPSKIVYGIDIADHTNDESLVVQLGIPFNKNVKSKPSSR